MAFSCKGRGVCPSCNTRRMAETAAHLTDHVFPRLPVRQWVLSVPVASSANSCAPGVEADYFSPIDMLMVLVSGLVR
jgi:hypothetical protein